jgi:hypothetical protein
MIETLFLIYLAGMPISLVFLYWAVLSVPREEMPPVRLIDILMPLMIWALLWPIFMALILYEVWSDEI